MVQLLTVLVGLTTAGSAWAIQGYGPKDGIDLKKPKEGCPCPPVHVPDSPADGLWCPPWWNCPIDPGPGEPAPPVAPLPLTLTASWLLPHSQIGNLSIIGGTGGGPRSRMTPLRLLSTLPGTRGSSYLGGGEPSVSGSSSAPLFGPEIDYPLPNDATGWMPFEASAQVYARVLLGNMDIDGESTSVQDYSAGLRLAIPVWRPPDFTLSPYVSAGPAFFRTEFGHVTGIDAAVGLRGDYRVSRSVALIVQIELDTFSSSDFFSWGPAGTLGLTIGF